MGKPAAQTNNKGNSGNTNGGTETSFTKTPQAKDDLFSSTSFGTLDYDNLVFTFDILANDLGGNGKSLWSVDDGINQSGAMDGYIAGDLLTQDFAEDNEASASGAQLSLTSDGQILFNATGIQGDLAALAEGEVMTDEFIYAIRLGNGTLSWANAAYSITGINDAPTLESTAIATSEDAPGNLLDLTTLGDDVDSDNPNGDGLIYQVTDTPAGVASVSTGGTDFLFDPNGEFESLAFGTETNVVIGIRTTDVHGATADATVTVTINGVNDAPTLDSASLTTDEDSASSVLDLSVLGDDIDSDNDGSNLIYSVVGAPAAGIAAINVNDFVFDPNGDFEYLAVNQTADLTIGIRATDNWGEIADADVTVTVTGRNDAPTLAAGALAATEDGAAVSFDLSTIGDDIDSDNDGSDLIYSVADAATGSVSVSDNILTYDPGTDFQTLSVGETTNVDLTVTAKDRHGEQVNGTVTVTVTGVNDAPTLEAGALAASEDGAAVSLDLSVLGDDIDSDDDGASLRYSVANASVGSASVNDTVLTYDPGTEFQSLAAGETTDVILAITAKDKHEVAVNNFVTATVTGVNDAPTLQAGALAASEDGSAVTLDLSTLGDDIDSDNDGTDLTYSVASAPLGSASVSGTVLTYDPGSEFQSLAAGETTEVVLAITAKDKHDVTVNSSVTATVTGVNDAPTLQAGALAASEDGSAVTLDLSALGDDIDSDDDGASLIYSVADPAAGSASINGTVLTYDPGAEFQSLSDGETAEVDLTVTAEDQHGAQVSATVKVTVTGVNDAPTLAAAELAAIEDGSAVTLDLSALGDDIDSEDDGSTLTYSVGGSTAGAASTSGSILTFDPGADFQYLAAGEQADVVLTITATDAQGATAENSVTVTVSGVNDAPEITGGDVSGAVTLVPGVAPFTIEQWTGYRSTALADLQNYATSNSPDYTATASIIDFTDDPAGFAGLLPGSSPWPAAIATGASGTGGINNDFFARITANIQITAADTYTFRTYNDDGVYLHVNGQEVIADSGIHAEAQFTGSINLTPGVYPLELYFFEYGGEASLELSFTDSSGVYQHVNTNVGDSGSITFADVDLSDTHTVSVIDVGDNLGNLTAVLDTDTTGSGTGGLVDWNYQVANDAYQSLGEGDTAIESFTVSVSDGKGGVVQQQVDITINGVNDIAELGNAVVDIEETNAAQTVSGTLSISDVDDGEAFFNPLTDVAGTYGSFSIDANGDWSFTTDGALDYLEAGEVVSEFFTVSSIDGTESTVTVNITGTADGPTAENDSNSLAASSVSNNADNTVYWVDWTSASVVATNGTRNPTYSVQGTITLADRTIDVTYQGQAAEPWGAVPGVQYLNAGSADYYVTKNGGSITSTEGVGVFTSPEVGNGPSNNDIIRLHHADSPRTLTFSEPVENLFFAIVSMNNNGYIFDQNFEVVSYANSSSNSGYFGHTDAYTVTNPEPGRYGISTAPAVTGVSGATEFHGVLAINNALESLTWESQADENWNGFTIGTYGVASSATVSGNVLTNDDAGNTPPVTVSDVDGAAMTGNSVTLNLTSGAILKVDSDGDYLYDDNNAFTALAAGQTHTDTVTYTVEDIRGYTATATLSITVTGINDTPVAVDDSLTTPEDQTLSISFNSLLGNDTDVDTGDTKSLVSVQDAVNGSVSMNSSGISFSPVANFNGTASFTYTMKDAAGATSSATVEILVTPEPDTYAVVNLVSNGSFEVGSTPPVNLNGWTSSQINYIGDWDAADGSKMLDMNAENGGGYVEQSLNTTANQTYSVFFALSKNPGSLSGSETLRVTAAGTSNDYTYSQSNSTADMKWENKTLSFTASSSQTTLRLASTDSTVNSNDAWGPALDEVVVVERKAITGFDMALGDVLDLSQLMDSIGAPETTAFSAGYLKFEQVGSDTKVYVDPDGYIPGVSTADYIETVTLVGVTLTPSDTDNYML